MNEVEAINGINFDQEVKPETITWLIEQINIYESPLNIYIRSYGGEAYSVLSVIDLINNCKKDITLIGFDEISSAAFDIFLFTNCKKRLIKGTYAIIHKTILNFDTKEENTALNIELKRKAKQTDDILYRALRTSKALTAAELKAFKENKDVIVSYEKLKKILKIK